MEKVKERVIRVSGCDECPHVYLERPKMVAHICAHKKMERRFDVTTFVARNEIPKHCPLEALK